MLVIKSKSHEELIDITRELEILVEKSGVEEGILHVFLPHASAALIMNENHDPNICIDFLRKLSDLVPDHDNYLHDRIDNNAAAHIKASLLRPDLALHITDGKLVLGTWQAVMLAEFDGPRERKILTKIL
ncbi:MAG: secondary thiamine-phosphate synthase enzyme YjbQ [Nanoarchaeota archaeon]